MMVTHVINGGLGPIIGDLVYYHIGRVSLPAKVMDVNPNGTLNLRCFRVTILNVDFGDTAGRWMWRKRDLKPIRNSFAYKVRV